MAVYCKLLFHLSTMPELLKKTSKQFLLTTLALLLFTVASISQSIKLDMPPAVMKGVKIEMRIHTTNTKIPQLLINGIKTQVQQDEQGYYANYTFQKTSEITIIDSNSSIKKEVDPIPLWLSILPPLIAILMALISKEVFSSLFVGLLIGTATIYKYAGANFFVAVAKGALAIVDTYMMESLVDADHISIIIFSMLIGGMVSIISLNGGMKGVVNILSRYANNRRSGQFITLLMGIIIFFDDYANTLVVGNTMRPVTDKLKISREKLAYLVDSTSAPIAATAFITTWIGAELSYIQEGISSIGINTTAYSVFLNSLRYSFYPILSVLFVAILIGMQRDFGPMLKAEKKASSPEDDTTSLEPTKSKEIAKEFEAAENVKPRWYNAAIPIMVVVVGTLIGLVYTGWSDDVWAGDISFTTKLSITIGNANVFNALLWSSFTALLIALLLTSAQKIISMKDSIEASINGFKTMFHALLILSLAWSLALLTKHLHTADYITEILTSINITPTFLPALTFIFGALIAFSTGSSWGTMAIIYPLILPAAWKLGVDYGLSHDEILPIFYNVVSTVLAGSVLGDHCSPISDTTILSSLACSCNHIQHVKTQMPYALTVAGVSLVGGILPIALGLPTIFAYILSIVLLILAIRLWGKKV